MSQAVTRTYCYSQMYENRKCVFSTDHIEYSQVLTSPVTVVWFLLNTIFGLYVIQFTILTNSIIYVYYTICIAQPLIVIAYYMFICVQRAQLCRFK